MLTLSTDRAPVRPLRRDAGQGLDITLLLAVPAGEAARSLGAARVSVYHRTEGQELLRLVPLEVLDAEARTVRLVLLEEDTLDPGTVEITVEADEIGAGALTAIRYPGPAPLRLEVTGETRAYEKGLIVAAQDAAVESRMLALRAQARAQAAAAAAKHYAETALAADAGAAAVLEDLAGGVPSNAEGVWSERLSAVVVETQGRVQDVETPVVYGSLGALIAEDPGALPSPFVGTATVDGAGSIATTDGQRTAALDTATTRHAARVLLGDVPEGDPTGGALYGVFLLATDALAAGSVQVWGQGDVCFMAGSPAAPEGGFRAGVRFEPGATLAAEVSTRADGAVVVRAWLADVPLLVTGSGTDVVLAAEPAGGRTFAGAIINNGTAAASSVDALTVYAAPRLRLSEALADETSGVASAAALDAARAARLARQSTLALTNTLYVDAAIGVDEPGPEAVTYATPADALAAARGYLAAPGMDPDASFTVVLGRDEDGVAHALPVGETVTALAAERIYARTTATGGLAENAAQHTFVLSVLEGTDIDLNATLVLTPDLILDLNES